MKRKPPLKDFELPDLFSDNKELEIQKNLDSTTPEAVNSSETLTNCTEKTVVNTEKKVSRLILRKQVLRHLQRQWKHTQVPKPAQCQMKPQQLTDHPLILRKQVKTKQLRLNVPHKNVAETTQQ